MHEAYRQSPILKNLPIPIECIACWGGHEDRRHSSSHSINNNAHGSSRERDDGVSKATLLVGTKPGHLLVYTVDFSLNQNNANVRLERSNKSFSKKPILQLFVCVELKLILSLSDSAVSVHDLHTFQLVSTIQKSKGASCFSADLESQISSRGEAAYTLRLCIAVKKKLQIYFWKKGDFHELCPDINLPDLPKCMAWCKDSIFLGFKRDYHIVSMKPNAVPRELFPTGRLLDPVMSKLDVDHVILVTDNSSILVDNKGNEKSEICRWSDSPLLSESQIPYILSILPSYVEVRMIEPNMQIQNLEFPKAKFLSKWREWIFIASTSNIWGIIQYPTTHQIKQLLRDKQYKLALKIAETMPGNDKEISDQVKDIKNLFAFELFCHGQFEESLEVFSKLGTDPAQVIGLYPNLLPPDFKKHLLYPSEPPALSGIHREKAFQALIEYLTEKRNETLNEQKLPSAISIVEGNRIIRSRSSLLQIIDTTLLKCYLYTNDALIAPLLRLPENFCHPEECEKELKNANKYPELIILYRKKNLHRKALALLMEQSETGSQEAIIAYLQHLGHENLELIFEYAPVVLEVNQNDGLKIFTEDIPEIDSLPKKQVLDFLERLSPDLALKYLVHLVYEAEDQTTEFHNKMILAYQRKVVTLMDSYHNELPEVDKYSSTRGPEELVELRSKLLCFLETSTQYNARRLLKEFEGTDLAEECAVLLGRDGQHEKALGIYANDLNQPERAEEYCRKVYDQDSVINKDVFLSLLKMYLHSQNDESENAERRKQDYSAAFRVLRENSNRIDCIKALSILPGDTDIKNIREFLENVIEKLKESRREANILESLILSEKRLVNERRMRRENHRCDITEDVVCMVCFKRIGDSAFARYPNGAVVHYYCSKDRKIAPKPET